VLYNRQDRVYGKVQTDDLGQFRFLGLFPDLYSVRVTLATFVPALKKNILVQPGMRSVLNVNLNTLFSTIQLAYPSVESGSLMSDEWKWVLRTASSTRPVLRFSDSAAGSRATSARSSMFSDTRGILRVSAGDGPLVTGIANEADLGTAFALATSLYGDNMLQVSGNVGYGSQTGVPTAAFRTSYGADRKRVRFADSALHVGLPERPHADFRGHRASVRVHARLGLVLQSPELFQPLRAPEL
jgi:hypothetical protein